MGIFVIAFDAGVFASFPALVVVEAVLTAATPLFNVGTFDNGSLITLAKDSATFLDPLIPKIFLTINAGPPKSNLKGNVKILKGTLTPGITEICAANKFS